MLPRPAPRLLALPALLLAACVQTSGGAGGAPSTTADSLCDSDPRAMAYATGLSAKSSDGTLKASFVGAMPAPPEKGLNTWTLQLTDGGGNAVSGAAVTVDPWMPDHGHGSSIVPQVMPMSSAGTYQVTLLDLFMPGIWQVTFDVTPASGPPETVVFSFCIDG
jgi:YtkA-like